MTDWREAKADRHYPLIGRAEPSTWTKATSALSRAGWGDWVLLAMFAVFVGGMVLA